jgi:hypothetical protein
LGGLPKSITSLNISWSKLDQKTAVDLTRVLSGIPKHITELTISLSDIATRTNDELITLGKTLSHIKTLYVINARGKCASHPSINTLQNGIDSNYIIRF